MPFIKLPIIVFDLFFLYECFALSFTTLSKLPPHAGYHGSGADPRKPFFEGWYLRLVTKNQGSIALIYHVFDPHLANSQRRGVGMQIITPSGTAIVESPDFSTFRADPHQLTMRNYFDKSNDYFRLTSDRASGRAYNAKFSSEEIVGIEYDFDIFAQIGWGGYDGARQYSTAGWLAAFPVFEPHYQVLISKGKTMGSFTLLSRNGARHCYDLNEANMYLEKNWGGSFPSQWWWIQANTFKSDLCVTSTAGRRGVPILGQEEEVGLIGLHWNGDFLPFPNVSWDVRWGQWRITGQYNEYSVILTGTCDTEGFAVNCPTSSGMEPVARETFHGTLRVQLYKNGNILLDDFTDEACLELGGLPWTSKSWRSQSQMKEPIKTIAMNVKLENQISNILKVASAFIEIPGL